MRSCPRCGKTYPDSEGFCEDDGTALLTGGGRATTVMPADAVGAQTPLECPSCGGKAEPGEVICNFCGTRLVPEGAAESASAEPSSTTRTTRNPENFAPASEWIQGGGTHIIPPDRPAEEEGSGRGVLGIIGYCVAAIVALGAGAWLALYLTQQHPVRPVAQASPAPTPALIGGPSVQLASSIPLQVTGDSASAPERASAALGQVFEANKAALLDDYSHALAGNSALEDGMVVRLHIMPDGSVSSGAVRVSTASNPGLDAEVIKTMNSWDFAPLKGGSAVDADFPVIFANKPGDVAAISAGLGTKLASLPAGEAPEFSSGLPPAEAPTPALASAPSAVATPPAAAAVETPHVARRHRPRREVASARPFHKPAVPPLRERVLDELRANRRFRRVDAYTSGGTVTLFGKAFDEKDKEAAAREVARVSGVTNVVNNIATDTSQWAYYQNQIEAQLQNAGLNNVTAKVIGKDCYLNGEVRNDLDRERAATIAERAAPVTVRVNLIRVTPGSIF